MQTIVKQVFILLFNRITKIDCRLENLFWKAFHFTEVVCFSEILLWKLCHLTHSDQSCPREWEFRCKLLASECTLQFYKPNPQLNPYPSLKKVFTISSQLQSCEVWRPETEQWEALDIRLRESHNNAMLWTDPAGTIWLIGTVRSWRWSKHVHPSVQKTGLLHR